MPELSRCPSCDRWVGIPSGLDALSTVRCPMCHEQYMLQRVLDTAPPLLEVVAPAPSRSSVSSPGTNTERGAEPPCAEPPSIDIHETDTCSHDHPVSVSSSPSAIQVHMSGESAQDKALPDLAPVATLSRRRSSVLAKMAGVVVGGIMGLAIGYLILLWIGGPEKDFLNISHELPQWMLPVEFRRGDPPGLDAFRGPPARAEPTPPRGAWRRQPMWRSVEPAPEPKPVPFQLSLPRAKPETASLSRLSPGQGPRSEPTGSDARPEAAAASAPSDATRPASRIPDLANSPATALSD